MHFFAYAIWSLRLFNFIFSRLSVSIFILYCCIVYVLIVKVSNQINKKSPRYIASLMPTLRYCKFANNCSLNLLLLKVDYLYQDFNSRENQVSSIYGMVNMTNQNRKKRFK